VDDPVGSLTIFLPLSPRVIAVCFAEIMARPCSDDRPASHDDGDKSSPAAGSSLDVDVRDEAELAALLSSPSAEPLRSLHLTAMTTPNARDLAALCSALNSPSALPLLQTLHLAGISAADEPAVETLRKALPRLLPCLTDLQMAWWPGVEACDQSAAEVVRALVAAGHRLRSLSLSLFEVPDDLSRACECAHALCDLMRGNETIEELTFGCVDRKVADSPIADLVDVLCGNPRSALTELEIQNLRIAPDSSMALTRLIALPRLQWLLTLSTRPLPWYGCACPSAGGPFAR
jgi:hypothetical protein